LITLIVDNFGKFNKENMIFENDDSKICGNDINKIFFDDKRVL
jgi:hypothetical protein